MKTNLSARREVTAAIKTKYLAHLESNYNDFLEARESNVETLAFMKKDFKSTLKVKPGKDFTRIYVRDSVHSFISMTDHGKIKCGDVLAPVKRTVPSENFVFANVLTSEAFNSVKWSGI
jgi:hypothetical protein